MEKKINLMSVVAMVMFIVLLIAIAIYMFPTGRTEIPWWLYGPWLFIIGQLSVLWGLRPNLPKYDWTLTRDGESGMLLLRDRTGKVVKAFIGLSEAVKWMREHRPNSVVSVHIDL